MTRFNAGVDRRTPVQDEEVELILDEIEEGISKLDRLITPQERTAVKWHGKSAYGMLLDSYWKMRDIVLEGKR